MPMTPPRRCSGCHELVWAKRCPTCTRTADARRGSASERGYTSKRWRDVRALKLSQDPLCSVCQKQGKLAVATDVDHLIRHSGPNDPLYWRFDLLDSKCHACHSRKTALHDSTFAHRGIQ